LSWLGRTLRFFAAASPDKHVAQCFYQVMQMLEPPSVLFRPDVMFRLLGAISRVVGN
jgi:hypothetical protein